MGAFVPGAVFLVKKRHRDQKLIVTSVTQTGRNNTLLVTAFVSLAPLHLHLCGEQENAFTFVCYFLWSLLG